MLSNIYFRIFWAWDPSHSRRYKKDTLNPCKRWTLIVNFTKIIFLKCRIKQKDRRSSLKDFKMVRWLIIWILLKRSSKRLNGIQEKERGLFKNLNFKEVDEDIKTIKDKEKLLRVLLMFKTLYRIWYDII